jgi:hypothetical protein
MTREDREQTMFDAECMRLHIRGRMQPWQRRVLASQALRKGLDDSVVWMELVELVPLVNWRGEVVMHMTAAQVEADARRQMMMKARMAGGQWRSVTLPQTSDSST